MLTYLLLWSGQVSVLASGVQSGSPCTRLEKPLCLQDIFWLGFIFHLYGDFPKSDHVPASSAWPQKTKDCFFFLISLSVFLVVAMEVIRLRWK